MCLVQNHRRVIRQHASVCAVAKGKVGEEEMMVNYDDVGLLRSISHPRDETGIEVGALLSEARLRACIDMAPEGERLRQVRQLGAVSCCRFSRPMRHLLEVVNLFQS